MRVLQGIDIVNVRRIRKIAEEQGKPFLERVFSREEIAYCSPRRMKHEHFAARFAAKEAFIKAVSLVTSIALPLNEIEVRHHASGRPFIRLSPALRKKIGLPGDASIDLSLSHERDYAVASVIILLPEKKTRKKKK